MMRGLALLAVASALLRGEASREQALARAAVAVLTSVEPEKAHAEANSTAKAPADASGEKKKVVSAAQQQQVMEQLMKLATNMETNAKQIRSLDAKDKATHVSSANLTHNMSDADKKMWDNFDSWNHRMNEKTQVGSMDVVSKIKKAMHFIKKGAMSGNDSAADALQDVIKSM